VLGGVKGEGAGALPDFAISGVVEEASAVGAEQSPARSGFVAGDVAAQHRDQDRGDGDAAGFFVRAVFEAAVFVAGARCRSIRFWRGARRWLGGR